MISFKEEFYKAIRELYPNGPEWDLIGIITKSSKVYTLSYDSKILSGIFEILTEPIVQRVADNNNLVLKKGVQNQYPEFTLYDESNSQEKIAVDMKSTYRKRNVGGDVKPFSFTLGSFRSYLQDPTGKKGILFPYKVYKEHWVIGFVYDRNPGYKMLKLRKLSKQLDCNHLIQILSSLFKRSIKFQVRHREAVILPILVLSKKGR